MEWGSEREKEERNLFGTMRRNKHKLKTKQTPKKGRDTLTRIYCYYC